MMIKKLYQTNSLFLKYIEILNELSKINLCGKLVEDLPSKKYRMNKNLLFPKCT